MVYNYGTENKEKIYVDLESIGGRKRELNDLLDELISRRTNTFLNIVRSLKDGEQTSNYAYDNIAVQRLLSGETEYDYVKGEMDYTINFMDKDNHSMHLKTTYAPATKASFVAASIKTTISECSEDINNPYSMLALNDAAMTIKMNKNTIRRLTEEELREIFNNKKDETSHLEEMLKPAEEIEILEEEHHFSK